MSKCISQHGEYSEHQVTDGVCDYCGVVDEDALITGLREIQELHKPCKTFSGKEVCDVCNTETGKPVSYPCPTRQLADKALGETNG